MFKGFWVEIALKFWEAEKDLNNRIQVARISKVLHACVAGTEDGYKDFTFFEDFRKSQTKIGFKVQFGYWFLCFSLFQNIDSEFLQMFSELFVADILIAGVAVNACRTIWGDRSKL